MFDMSPATEQMASLLRGVEDHQLAGPTPCPRYTLGDLIDHVNGLSLAFTWAATKSFPSGRSQSPSADASRLGPDWRTRIPEQLARLAEAWRDPAAWQGMTEAGGIDLPAQVAAGRRGAGRCPPAGPRHWSQRPRSVLDARPLTWTSRSPNGRMPGDRVADVTLQRVVWRALDVIDAQFAPRSIAAQGRCCAPSTRRGKRHGLLSCKASGSIRAGVDWYAIGRNQRSIAAAPTDVERESVEDG
jgi:Mycothiol maleylpyruvate isomerase N-terminal domain